MASREQYHRALKTITEMISDRHYILPDVYLGLDDRDAFERVLDQAPDDQWKNKLSTKANHRTLDRELYIVWVPGRQLNTNIKHIYTDLISKKCRRAIFIYDESITTNAKSIIASSRQIAIDAFSIDQLQINITKHTFQPVFELCSSTDLNKICESYGCTKSQLPKLLYDDPIRRYFGLSKNDLIKTTQVYGTLHDIEYRIVTD